MKKQQQPKNIPKNIKYNIVPTKQAPEKQQSDCLIVGIYTNSKLSPTAKQLDKASKGYLSALLKKGDIQGKIGETFLIYNMPNVQAERVLLVGCGSADTLKPSGHTQCQTQYKEILTAMSSALVRTQARNALLYLDDFSNTQTLYWPIRHTIDSLQKTVYQFCQFKTEKAPTVFSLDVLQMSVNQLNPNLLKEAQTAIEHGCALNTVIAHNKDLANMPPNICTPEYIALYAQKLATQNPKLKVSVLEEKQIKKLNMGLFLSVAQGSKNPPKFIILEYSGSPNSKTKKQSSTQPIILVGKGITFDTGGNSLKPSLGMVGMKYDMCGAATVLSVLEFASQLALPISLVGLIPTCENMPGADATRPDDIIESMSGLKVEIINTDAEGRLILADALTYAKRYNPKVVIDIATLTGACIAALGYHASGLLGNHPPLVQDLLEAGTQTGDRAWELPLWPEYEKILSSKFADISNANASANPNAGTITAACFLSKFTKEYHWAHLDVAGTACYFSGESQGATGRPVSLLTQYILNQININT